MKIYNAIIKTVMMAVLVFACQPDDITINKGPMFVDSVVATGTDIMTGQEVNKALVPNATSIPVNSVISVNLSKTVDPESVSGITMNQEGTDVPVTVSASGSTITIDPVNDMEPNLKYTLVFGLGIRAEDGGVFLSDSEKITFTSQPLAPSPYDGQIFYLPFDGDYTDEESGIAATVVGTPGFSNDAMNGQSYDGASGAYLTFPTTGLLSSEMTFSFWMKVNSSPDRAGVVTIGPPDPNNPATPNNRNSGFRFFREGSATTQRFKLNVGTGSSDSWFDGGTAADVDATTPQWVHFAYTIATGQATVYINGEIVSQGALTAVSWQGCDIMSIMSGAPRFTEWGHLSDESLMDEFRIFAKAMTQEEVQTLRAADMGAMFYMPFEDNYKDLITTLEATVVGTPGFSADAAVGDKSYDGATDSYLTFPGGDLQTTEFSASFWLKVNAVPNRAGVLVMGPPDPNLPATPNNRNNGFRFFREDAGGKQRFKLNIGTGSSDSWFDGGTAADVDPAAGEWVHFAFTISETEAKVYINGAVVSSGSLTGGIDWTGCDILSIMSGAPRFTEWGHLSDESLMDDLMLFDKVLTQEQIQTIIDSK